MAVELPTIEELRAFADAHGLSELHDEDLQIRLNNGSTNQSRNRVQYISGFFPELPPIPQEES